MSAINGVKRGDRFRWVGEGARWPLYMEITRVARDGSWADMRVMNWACAWSKRQTLPLPTGTERYRWSMDDLAGPTDEEWDAHLKSSSVES